jgi:hypothetical protein
MSKYQNCLVFRSGQIILTLNGQFSNLDLKSKPFFSDFKKIVKFFAANLIFDHSEAGRNSPEFEWLVPFEAK